MAIKRCPHCGGKAWLHSEFKPLEKEYAVSVMCEVCEAQGKIFISQTDPSLSDWENDDCVSAVDAWNLRSNIADQEEV